MLNEINIYIIGCNRNFLACKLRSQLVSSIREVPQVITRCALSCALSEIKKKNSLNKVHAT